MLQFTISQLDVISNDGKLVRMIFKGRNIKLSDGRAAVNSAKLMSHFFSILCFIVDAKHQQIQIYA